MTLAPWYATALAAAAVWGIHYPLIDFALRRISPFSVLLLTVLGVLAIAPWFAPELTQDVATLKRLPWRERLPIAAIAITSVVGSLLLFVAIGAKNATLASLIEISYPVFVALFAYLLFREWHLNAGVVVGAVLVFTGVALIARFGT